MSPSSSQSPPTTKDPPDRPLNPSISSPKPPQATSIPDTAVGIPSQPYAEPPTAPASSKPPPTRAPFSPFFTLINDAATSTTYHPTNIHYIFSDDDPELLTSACLDCLDPNQPLLQPSPSASASISSSTQHNLSTSSSTTGGISSSKTRAAAQQQQKSSQRERRILLLDLDESGTAITSAHSLSSSWQILSASLGPAPTWGDESSPSTTENDGAPTPPALMLRIEGTDGRDVGQATATGGVGGKVSGSGHAGSGRQDVGGSSATATGTVGENEFAALMEDFDRRMGMLRRVMEAGNVSALQEPGGEVEEEEVQGRDKQEEKKVEQKEEEDDSG